MMSKAFTSPLSQAMELAIRRRSLVVGWRRCGGGGVATIPAIRPQTHRAAISNCAVRCIDGSGDDKVRARKTTSTTTTTVTERAMAQSKSPLGRAVGVAAALAAAAEEGGGRSEETRKVKATLWDEFALRDRVGIVSGGNRGLGLEMALALIEAGARAVYCVDLPAVPGEEWRAVAEYVRRMEGSDGQLGGGGGGRLEYVCADVRDQEAMWKVGEAIGDREGRMDVCVAAAGILKAHRDCLEYPGEEFEQVRPFFFLVCFIVLLSLCGVRRGATDQRGSVLF
jgi:hypothetical protein